MEEKQENNKPTSIEKLEEKLKNKIAGLKICRNISYDMFDKEKKA